MQDILLSQEFAFWGIIASAVILLITCVGTSYWAETGLQKERMHRMKVMREATLRMQKLQASSELAKEETHLEPRKIIIPEIEIHKEKLKAWLCPMCSSSLTPKNVRDLKEGMVTVCPFCGVTIG